MTDDFFDSTAQTRVVSDLPRLQRQSREQQRLNLVGPIEAARKHLNNIRHNPLAVEHQHKRIAALEKQLEDFDMEWIFK